MERPESGQRALLVHVHLGPGQPQPEEISEFESLVLSAGFVQAACLSVRRAKPDARHFIGEGKLEEVRTQREAQGAELVIINHALSPGQERNLEKALQCRVMDRIGLILDIFAQRARTHEGKLQVELAQVHHAMSRLVRGWTHLERQRGGIGTRGGPGETQLEVDRRLLRQKELGILKRLEKVRSQREQGRRARQRAELPTVSLVGYTNAGKSTLFNTLTASAVYAADQLFATLDPTLRRLAVPGFGPVVIADTVGFIRDLPHTLVEAFRATLEETVEADLLLHVMDASSETRDEQQAQVAAVLEEIGAGPVPCLEVFNKIDLCADPQPRIERDAQGLPVRVRVSALTGGGLDLLMTAIAERLGGGIVTGTVVLAANAGRLRTRLYEDRLVLAEETDESGHWRLRLRLPRRDWERLCARAEVLGAEMAAAAA